MFNLDKIDPEKLYCSTGNEVFGQQSALVIGIIIVFVLGMQIGNWMKK